MVGERALNESPSEKEGKLDTQDFRWLESGPSMKVPPKRKGNTRPSPHPPPHRHTLNESPSEKEGKFSGMDSSREASKPSMKVPPKRKGNLLLMCQVTCLTDPSMKVPPKRKGNSPHHAMPHEGYDPLNESPSEKEGK